MKHDKKKKIVPDHEYDLEAVSDDLGTYIGENW